MADWQEIYHDVQYYSFFTMTVFRGSNAIEAVASGNPGQALRDPVLLTASMPRGR
jgi:hypothetical protein